MGRAKIEKSKQEQLALIEKNKNETLAKLNIKYAAADKVKTSFGYIGIISLSLLYGAIILNDLAKFLQLCYIIAKDLLKERREEKEKKENEKEVREVKIQIDDELYSQELEEKLQQINFQLIKACAKRSATK